jgi:hypothetical protein
MGTKTVEQRRTELSQWKRRLFLRDPRRLLFPARVRRERRGQFLRRGELHRRTADQRVKLVLVAGEKAVL